MRSSVAAVIVLAGCVAPRGAAPPVELLSAREILALSPAIAADLPEAARASLRWRLDDALAGEAAEAAARPRDPGAVPAAPILALSLPVPVRTALALDVDRRSDGRPPLLAARLAGGALSPLPITSFYAPTPPPAPPPAEPPTLAGRLPDPPPLLLVGTMDDGTQPLSREALAAIAAALAPLVPKGEQLAVRPVASTPFAVLYAVEQGVVYLNPVLFALRDAEGDRYWAKHALDRSAGGRHCDQSDAPISCLEDGLTLSAVDHCVMRVAPECRPEPGRTLQTVLKSRPICCSHISACIFEPVIDSPCVGVSGAASAPCSSLGAEWGTACGRGCGSVLPTPCECLGTNERYRDPCTGETRTDRSLCQDLCGSCGAVAGANGGRACSRTCSEIGARHTDEHSEDAERRLPPPPPLDPTRPPPARALVITGTRDLAAFLLPPLIFFTLHRRRRHGSGGRQ